MMYCMFCLFFFQVLEKPDLEVLDFDFFRIGYFGLFFIGIFIVLYCFDLQ